MGKIKAVLRSKSALSFVEIMTAVLVLGMVIVPLSQLFNRGATGTVQTRDEVLAYHYAEELLSWLQSKKYSDPDIAVTSAPKPFSEIIINTSGSTSEKNSIDTSKFTRTVIIREISPSPSWPYTYKILNVQISWKSGKVDRKIDMASLVYK
ncbi:MAG: hypothetical protein HQM10_14635 [Candidatus Riflebacteria bacterium]|nr:hypothetical protein [Candidatus Riflebacteria bacterium]